jgi:hypothetical protein
MLYRFHGKLTEHVVLGFGATAALPSRAAYREDWLHPGGSLMAVAAAGSRWAASS